MQITLKQSEIEVALKNYIVVQGINLTGKTIEVAFTAGRKEAGISAELDINDAGTESTSVQGLFLHRPFEPAVAVNTATATPVTAKRNVQPIQSEVPTAAAVVDEVVAEEEPVEAAPVVPAEAPSNAKTPVSLFGS